MKTSSIVIVILFSVLRITNGGKAFNEECLKKTNSYRAIHHAPPLKLDENLRKFAITRCKKVTEPYYLENGHELVAPDEAGENIYRTSANKVDHCDRIIDKWYSEISKYKFGSPSFTTDTAHFTQLVWKKTTEMGCARCEEHYNIGKFKAYVVCSYQKPAESHNTMELKLNVLPQ